MAGDVTQNSQQVVGVQPFTSVPGTAGETLNAGMPCYYNAAGDRRWYQAKASGNAIQSGTSGLGIALTTSYAAQPVTVFTGGTITLGTTAGNGANGTAQNGVEYRVSANSGRICPSSDAATNSYVSVLGVMVAGNLVTCSALLASNAQAP